jgi:hypothetical protein
MNDSALLLPIDRILGRQVVRRILAPTPWVVCALLIILPSQTRRDWAAFLLVVLLVLNVTLRRATRRVAVADERTLDAGERAEHSRAYRLAYRVVAIAVGIPLCLTFLGGGSTATHLAHAASNGGLIVFCLELLYLLPTAIIAWIEPDRQVEGPVRWRPTAWQQASVVLLTMMVAAMLWSLDVAFATSSSNSRHRVTVPAFGGASARSLPCAYFGATRQVGFGVEGTIRFSAEICWNGKRVWQVWGLNRSDCLPGSGIMTAINETCSTRFRRDGTMDVDYVADVRPSLLPFIHQRVEVRLVVRPNGRVARFP